MLIWLWLVRVVKGSTFLVYVNKVNSKSISKKKIKDSILKNEKVHRIKIFSTGVKRFLNFWCPDLNIKTLDFDDDMWNIV